MSDIVFAVVGFAVLFGLLAWAVAPYGAVSRLGAFISGVLTAALWSVFG